MNEDQIIARIYNYAYDHAKTSEEFERLVEEGLQAANINMNEEEN